VQYEVYWDIDQIAGLCLAIQHIPAPTFAEHRRAEFVAQRLSRMGLTGVEVDEMPNVYARLAGTGDGPGVMVSAHLDTVFPEDTDLSSRREGTRLYGPGVGDNSLGLAGLLTLAQVLATSARSPASDVWFVANAGEEGLGDLSGMRRALDRLGTQVKACIVLEGATSNPWTLTHRGLGVRRYRIEARTRGGHSWGDFGEPSAIHALVRLAHSITHWQVPGFPRTTFNIGVIEGGTSVNTIAGHASLLLDLRSEDAGELARLIARAEELVSETNSAGGAQVTASVVGDRPSGEIPTDHPLVMAAAQILDDLGVSSQDIHYRIGSTDANVPLSRGIPALTTYLTEGHDAHCLSEWLSLDLLPLGLTLAWRLMHRAIEWRAADAG
jgi:tripeptide aminopeptidase